MPRLTFSQLAAAAKRHGYTLEREGTDTYVLWDADTDEACGSLGEAKYVLDRLIAQKDDDE